MATPSGETYSERSKGQDVRTSNIVAAKAVANAVRTSLGPRGMDKLLQLPNREILISNDGATILSKMKVLHPAAKMLVELSQSQDIAAGDGTTTVVVLAGALLQACDTLLHKRIHPAQIAAALFQASSLVCDALPKVAQPVAWRNNREGLLAAVETCLSSKVVASNSDVFGPLAVDSVLALVNSQDNNDDDDSAPSSVAVDLRDIRIVPQLGGTVEDSELVHGLVLTKGGSKTSTSGAPTSLTNAKIGLIQYCLSAPKTDMDHSVVVSDYAAMDRILKQERKYILQLCKQIQKTGCKVLLIQKSILRDAYNELSLHFLAKMGILVVTDIERSDVEFICRTVGCQPVAHPDQWGPDKLGQAEQVAEVFMEGARTKVVKFTGITKKDDTANNNTVTVLLRGSSNVVLEEAERSLHDAQCVVRSLLEQPYLIAGGGAAEMQAALTLQAAANQATGKDAYCFRAFAEAFTVIPYTLAENAGLPPVQVVTQLRAAQASGVVGAGIHVKPKRPEDVVTDMYPQNVVQPLKVSTSAVRLATETVALIMKIDDLIVIQ